MSSLLYRWAWYDNADENTLTTISQEDTPGQWRNTGPVLLPDGLHEAVYDYCDLILALEPFLGIRCRLRCGLADWRGWSSPGCR